jgi:hypothetical protein
VNEIRERLAKMRRLVELRERLGRVAEGENAGLAAIKAEGAAIVAAREKQLAEQEPPPAPVEELEAKPKRRRRRRRKGAVEDPVSTWDDKPAAVNAAQRNIDDALPDYTLRRDDGSECTTTHPNVGPN